jgi:hypothetical protein
MALTFGFFDAAYDSSTDTYDRTYSAEQMSLYFKGLVSDGVIANVGNMLAVSPRSGMSVQVGTGRMLIDSRWLQNDAAYNVTLQTAHATLNRKDIIVARLDYSGRAIGIIAKTGTAAASPAAPGIVRNGEYFEMELAEIYVSAGATAITAANITDKRANTSVCGYVTGLVDQIETSGMWAQLQDNFETWFEGIRGQLDGDTAGNLQNQINTITGNVSNNTSNIAANTANISNNTAAINTLTGSTTLSGVDLNTLTTTGTYRIDYNSANKNLPSAGIRGVLQVIAAEGYIIQRYTEFGGYDNGNVYQRINSGQNWLNWRRFAKAGE